MNVIERKLNVILSESDDIANEVLQMCEDLNVDEIVSLNLRLQNELRYRLAANKLEEDVWDRLLSIMSPNELSEEVLNYLIQNQISLPRLCHMQLQDKWLMKLISFDDAPLYALVKRYYLSDDYSLLDFIQFYNQYLWNRSDVCLYLLDIYGNVDKRGLLISLCLKNKDFEHKEMLKWHQVADQVRELTSSTDIASVYMEYQNVGIVLAEIASNYFTSEEILLELLSAQGIKYANRIRKNSEETLKLKRIEHRKE